MTHAKPVLLALLTLLGLLALTVGLSLFSLGPLGPALALAIAVAKALIIAAIFMELRTASGTTRLFAAAGVLWLGLLLALTLADFLTRG